MVGKRVMIVEDAGLVRLYYRDALQRAGYEVNEAMNGLEALEKLLVAPVDLLVVDVNMPKMDGLTFLKALRRQPLPLGATPAVVISTEAGSQDREAARAAGANFYLTKPIAQDALNRYAEMLCGNPT
jgi:two-component system, chemotaxis family, chemotaxis protein CheY